MRSSLAAVCVLVSAVAHAEEPWTHGYFVGARTGGARFFGAVSRESDALPLDRVYALVIPVWLELGYRMGPHLSFGVFGQLNAVWPLCVELIDCSGDGSRAGLFATFHAPPRDALHPWLGVTAGVETSSLSFLSDGARVRRSHIGPELVGLQAGADFPVHRGLMVGPYMAGALGSYVWTEGEEGARDFSQPIFARSLHVWLSVGVRGVFLSQ